jgi:aryl-alcohol dehydrogenase-like predicted oxidoreductase
MHSLGEAIGLLDLAFELGIRHYDTAPIYGNGYSEVIYGRFLKNRRNEVFLVSKFGLGSIPKVYSSITPLLLQLNYIRRNFLNFSNGGSRVQSEILNNFTANFDGNYVAQSVESSLKRLKTDHLDALMLHEALPFNLSEDCLFELLKLKESGKVLMFGIATNINRIFNESFSIPSFWDILQYEGNNLEMKKEIMERFPECIHYHHSILKNHSYTDKIEYSKLLINAINLNPSGKVIFSTKSKFRLSENLRF